jgi:hypothetical protein
VEDQDRTIVWPDLDLVLVMKMVVIFLMTRTVAILLLPKYNTLPQYRQPLAMQGTMPLRLRMGGRDRTHITNLIQ